MATTFNWIYLGVAPIIDPTEGNTNSENASALVGQTYGSTGSPLYNAITSATTINVGGTAGVLDTNNNVVNDQFTTNIGAGVQTFTYDGTAIYNATITYADGTTATVTAVVAQSTTGELFLAPEIAANADTTAYELRPIRSVTFNSINVSTNVNFGADRLMTGFDNGIISGTAGGDLINASYVEPIANGSDRVDNGDGVLVSSLNDDRIEAGAGNDTIVSGEGNDSIFGGLGDDQANGGNGDDTIFGEDGADSLTGAAGADQLFGGAGIDSLFGGAAADSLDGGAEGDLLFGGAGIDTLLGGDGADSLDGGTEGDQIFGGTGNDTLVGGDGADSLNGGTEADLLYGGIGDDTLAGDAGNDTLFGDAGADSLIGNQGMDFVDYAASGAGVTVDLAAGTGAGGDAAGDTLAGVDGIIGSAFDDILLGFDGFSAAPGDPFTNVFFGGAGNDLLDGRGGDDSLYGGADNDTVLGGGGADLLEGGTGQDQLTGGAGNDTVLGGAGNDTLTIDGGVDQLFGGSDRDRFVMELAGGPTSTVDGGNDGDDFDVLDLSAWGKDNTVVFREPGNPQTGYVDFFDDFNVFLGRMNFTEVEQVIPCFTPGTRIVTDQGERAVEDLAVGDRVLTRDNGFQVLRWVGRRDLSLADLLVQPRLRPVRLAADCLGPDRPARDMMVSPQHRMLMDGARSELLFGETEVLVAALHLCGQPGIDQRLTAGISYIHLLFDQHEIIHSDGLWTESFQPAARMVTDMDAVCHAEILLLFPELAAQGQAFDAARLTLKAHEARVLLSA